MCLLNTASCAQVPHAWAVVFGHGPFMHQQLVMAVLHKYKRGSVPQITLADVASTDSADGHIVFVELQLSKRLPP